MSSSSHGSERAAKADNLIRLVYHSTCAIPDYPEVVGLALDDIIESATRHNLENGISGALLYADRQFIQVVEGPALSVDETFARIQNDKRHRDIRMVCRVPMTDRLFERWPIAFLSEPELRPTLQHVGMKGAFDISRLPTDLIGPFLSSMLGPVIESSRMRALPTGVNTMLARAG